MRQIFPTYKYTENFDDLQLNMEKIEHLLKRKVTDEEKATIIKSYNENADGTWDMRCIDWRWNGKPTY